MNFGKDAQALGAIDPSILNRSVTIALGQNRHDKNWRNFTGTVGQVLEFLGTFQRGDKDGQCMLQGALVGTQRIAKNVIRNDFLIIDIDTGMSVEEVGTIINQRNLFCVLWTTHSFGKDTTEIAEEHFLRWCKKNGKPVAVGPTIQDQLYQYLKEEKRYRPAVFTTFEYKGRFLVEGGMKYVVKHAPMPKLRVCFLLSKPFDFTEGSSQKTRIEEWKQAYVNASAWLGVAYDSSCVDPSRLMYTPRIPANAEIKEGAHEIIIFDGECLNIDALKDDAFGVVGNMMRVLEDEGIADNEDRPKHNFKTPNLLKFVKEHPDFDIIGFLEATAPDDRRSPGDAEKVDWTCPNEESHTTMNAEDRAFMATFDGENWYAGCLHDGCKHASGGDRLWYLDMLCQKYGINDAMELTAWSGQAQVKQIEASKAVETSNDKNRLETLIAELTNGTSFEDLDKVLTAVGLIDNPILRDKYIDEIAEKTTHKVNPIKSRMKTLVAAAKLAIGGVTNSGFNPATGHAVPDDLENASTIWTDWDWDVLVTAAKKRLKKRNRDKPTVFMRPDNHTFRIVTGPENIAIVEEMTSDRWTALIDDGLRFKETDAMTGRNQGVPQPRSLKSIIAGSSDMDWPMCHGISRIAVFGKDGTLHSQKGYDKTLGVYLDPNYVALPVPDVVTPDDINVALSWLYESIVDFPFSDVFEGGDKAAIYTDEKDKDGHPIPNWNRGRSSRAHMLAAMLQPFARAMIDGPTPGYHVDKPAAGTGAGYLVNVISCIVNGHTATAQTMSESNEEFRKEITATLREGAQMIFVDNINRRVNSGELAAALTTGNWKARKLGVSENIDVPVRAMWIFAGNNLTFSHELMRRMVPIRLDAQTQNPAKDRPKTFFKHNPLQDWLITNRPHLIWACQVVIKWWIQHDCPPGSKTLNSFDHWARVMGGIIETAGVAGFLDNVEQYTGVNDEEDDTERQYAEYFFDGYGDTFFTTGQAVTAVLRKSLGMVPENFPTKYDMKDDAGNVDRFGKWINRVMKGRTYLVDKGGKQYKVSLTRSRTDKKRGWKMTVVGDV